MRLNENPSTGQWPIYKPSTRWTTTQSDARSLAKPKPDAIVSNRAETDPTARTPQYHSKYLCSPLCCAFSSFMDIEYKFKMFSLNLSSIAFRAWFGFFYLSMPRHFAFTLQIFRYCTSISASLTPTQQCWKFRNGHCIINTCTRWNVPFESGTNKQAGDSYFAPYAPFRECFAKVTVTWWKTRSQKWRRTN